MSRKFLLLFGFAVSVLTACTQDKMSEPSEEMTGEVFIALHTEGMEPLGKAVVEVGVPRPEDLTVEVFKKSDLGNVRLFRDTYENVKDKSIKLNCAEYNMLAFYGDSLAVDENMPYYEGNAGFAIGPQNRTVEVDVTAKVANVRVTVEYGENLRYDYPEFYAKVRSETPGGCKKTAEFYQDEYRKKVFVPYGTLYFELYAKVDGQWKYFPAKAISPKRGDDITFKVETTRLIGRQGITVTVAQLEQKEVAYEVSSAMLPQDAPEISATGLPQETVMVEGDAARTGLRMDLVVDGNIKECWLNIDSEYLAALGVPSRVDIASDDMSAKVRTALENVGLKWMNGMAGRRFAYIDFSGITKFLGGTSCDPDNLFRADFSVDVVDQRHNPDETSHKGTFSSKTYSFVQGVPSPSLKVSGFEKGDIEILEGMGVTYDGLKAEVVAKGRIGHCYLYVSSKYMNAAGIPARVDLADVDETTAQKLKDFGISWPANIASRTSAVIDFSGVSDYMDGNMYKASSGDAFASFTLRVENAVVLDEDKRMAAASVGGFRYLLPAATVSTIQDYNVWAKKIYDFNVNLTKGNPKHLKLQYSTDNATWTDIAENTTLDGNVLSCSKLTTLSNTLYNIRAIYHDNPDLCVNFNPVTTEAEAQIPNSDFETWSEFIHTFTAIGGAFGGGSKDYIWHRPYGPDLSAKVWDLNAKISMPSSQTGWTNFNVKCFPCAGRSTDRLSGSYSALIFVVNVGYDSTDGIAGGKNYVGELFVGSASEAGAPSYGKASFPSRPSALKINYKYQPYSTENFSCEVNLYSGADVIASGAFIDGSSAHSWSSRVLPLTYTDLNSKPTHISVAFKATTGAKGVNTKVTIEYNGSSHEGHFGSQLRLDDLQLIYE